MTDQWKLDVQAALDAKDPSWSRRKLAALLGVTPGLITKLLKPASEGGQQVSALVPMVSELLGVPMPHEPARSVDDRRRKLDEILDRMTEEQLEGVAAFLSTMIR
jgi:hypothetical protein